MWYAEQNGMTQIDTKSELKVGDTLLYPLLVSQQKINGTERFKMVREIVIPGSGWTMFSTSRKARFYASSIDQLPWNFTKSPLAVFRIYQVTDETQATK